MKILIAYISKFGTTKQCAHDLGALFSMHEVTYADLAENEPDLTKFDLVAIGAPVRYGKIHKRAIQFVTQNADTLTRFGLFMCCGFPDAAEDCFRRSYPADILNASLANMSFGGEMRPEKVKGFEKFVVKLVLHNIRANNRNEDRDRDIPFPALVPENIRLFADALRGN